MVSSILGMRASESQGVARGASQSSDHANCRQYRGPDRVERAVQSNSYWMEIRDDDLADGVGVAMPMR